MYLARVKVIINVKYIVSNFLGMDEPTVYPKHGPTCIASRKQHILWTWVSLYPGLDRDLPVSWKWTSCIMDTDPIQSIL